jgi:hypothetical protein
MHKDPHLAGMLIWDLQSTLIVAHNVGFIVKRYPSSTQCISLQAFLLFSIGKKENAKQQALLWQLGVWWNRNDK